MQGAPGTYGPEFAQPGFRENGTYFEAGTQARVDYYGGNLVVSATDVAIPGQGRFPLSFTRTFSSANLFLPAQAVSNQADGPLGEGWVGHYGLLWPAGTPLPGGGGVPHPEFVDRNGGRHLFYRHDHLDSEIPLTSAGTNPEWISTSFEVLLQVDVDLYELLTPDGLRYRFERLVDQGVPRYQYLVPTRVDDCHGNSITITYEPDAIPYFEHPLVASVSETLSGSNPRSLHFGYADDAREQRAVYELNRDLAGRVAFLEGELQDILSVARDFALDQNRNPSNIEILESGEQRGRWKKATLRELRGATRPHGDPESTRATRSKETAKGLLRLHKRTTAQLEEARAFYRAFLEQQRRGG